MSISGVFLCFGHLQAGITSEYTNYKRASVARPDLRLPAADLEPFGKHFPPLCARCLRIFELYGILNSFVNTGNTTL